MLLQEPVCSELQGLRHIAVDYGLDHGLDLYHARLKRVYAAPQCPVDPLGLGYKPGIECLPVSREACSQLLLQLGQETVPVGPQFLSEFLSYQVTKPRRLVGASWAGLQGRFARPANIPNALRTVTGASCGPWLTRLKSPAAVFIEVVWQSVSGDTTGCFTCRPGDLVLRRPCEDGCSLKTEDSGVSGGMRGPWLRGRPHCCRPCSPLSRPSHCCSCPHTRQRPRGPRGPVHLPVSDAAPMAGETPADSSDSSGSRHRRFNHSPQPAHTRLFVSTGIGRSSPDY